MQRKLIKTIALLLIPVGFTACSSSIQNDLLPEGDKTMAEVWAENTGGSTYQSSGNVMVNKSTLQARASLKQEKTVVITPAQQAHIQQAKVARFTRNAKNEIDNLFPRLPNPDLVMFVFPHMTESEEPLPVPGYSTVFPLYSRTPYAEPGDSLTGL